MCMRHGALAPRLFSFQYCLARLKPCKRRLLHRSPYRDDLFPYKIALLYGGNLMRSALLTLAVSLIVTTILSAQTPPAVCAQPNSVYAGADGKFEAAPDT